MNRKYRLAASACATTVALGAFASGGFAQDSPERRVDRPKPATAKLRIVERPAARFERSIEVHRLQTRLGSLRDRAAKLGVQAPRDPGASAGASTRALGDQVARLERVVQQAEREAAEFGSVAGVSQATLDAIAACESGGDPTAVNPAGYYGKYQFDTGTWAAVGGSGNPAEAPEAEQDYRAALLLSRAGASPWPVCGA